MHGLDIMLSRHSQLLVLRVLYHADEPLTGREVERRTGLSNRTTMLALDSLTDAAVVHRDFQGNAHLYVLNSGHYLVAKALRPAFEAEDLFWDDLRKTVRRVVHPRPIAVVATGPLARDESLFSGRVEFTMLFSTGRNRIRAFASTEELRDVAWDRYGLDVDTNLVDINIMDREEYGIVWRRVEREGILLFGQLP